MIGAILFAANLSVNAARAIAIAPRERPSWVLLDLPQQIDSGPDGEYGDLRIFDDRGRETPYVVDPHCANIPTREASVSDTGFVQGKYTEALLDSGTSGTLYSAISIGTSASTFFDRVAVAISDDRSTWREVRSDALIYRVADSGDPGSQTIAISPARARWIRIRVMDGRQPFPIDSASLDGAESAAPERMKQLDATARISPQNDNRTSVLTLDLGTANTRVARIGFQTSQPEFSRGVSLETSDDGEHWSFAGGGRIERFAHGAPVLDVPLSDSSARYVRAEVFNGSDDSLPGLSASAYGPRRVLVFVARPGRAYALVRTPHAQAPNYDLGTLLEHDNPRSFALAHLEGSEYERNTERPQPAFSQPRILTWAFAIAILVFGAVTLATLRPRSS